MVNNINKNADLTLETSSGVVELASLVWSYFSKENLHDLLEEDFKLLKKLKRGLKWLQDGSKEKVDAILDWEKVEYTKDKTSELEELVKNKEEEYNKRRDEIKTAIDMYVKWELWDDVISTLTTEETDDLDLDAILDPREVEVNTLERMRELYSDQNIRESYLKELEDRKDNFEMLDDWKKGLEKVLKIEETIKKAKKFILWLRIKSFVTHKTLTPAQVAKIKQIQSLIVKEENKKVELLQSRETATAHRLWDLKRYRKDLEDKGFITFPSRQKIIDEVIEKLVMWENVLLSWPTWTGKTVLAIKALESLNIGYSDISWKTLSDDIKAYNSEEKEKSWVVDEFAMILSGHWWITASEFIAKPALKWQIETTTELWKLLKAFVDWKVPVIDEIDLIPNDVLMRVKHLFTLKPWSEYAPQEDGNKRYTLNSTWIIATANIKSEKHPDREELDPAIVRLFKWVQVPYFTTDETYDLALANLMEKWGFIYDLDKESLWKDNILYNLVKALKEIEDSYLWKWTWLSINVWWSDKSWIYLQKAILEIWNFASMFKWFKESWLWFKQFIKTKIAEFVSNGAYPVNDRLLLIKIFSQNWLIIMSDISLLEERIVDISRVELERNIMWRDDIFNDWDTKFIDSYELSNLDPYGIRNLSDLNLSDKNKKQKTFIKLLSQKSIENHWDETWDNIADISDRLLENMEWKTDYETSKDDIDNILELIWKTRYDQDVVDLIEDLWWYWLDKYNILKEEDSSSEFANTPTTTTSNSNEWLTENMSLTWFITSRRLALLDQYKNDGTVDVNWATLEVNLSESDKNWVNTLNPDDIEIKSEKNIIVSWEKLSVSEVLINGISFMAIQVPEFLKWKKLRETYIWEQLAKNSDLWEDFLDQEINNDYIIYWKTYIKDNNWDNVINISSYNTSSDTDAVRECMKLWFNTSNIVYEAILWELIKKYLWDEYVSFEWVKADKDESWYEKLHPLIEKVEEEFWIDYWIKTDNFSSQWYMFRDYWVYKNSSWTIRGFLRGNDAYGGAIGGAVSLLLRWRSGGSSGDLSFRPSV